MTETNKQTNLDARLREVWKRGQRLHLSAGLLAFCRWAVPLFLAGMALDWLTHMPAPGRMAILAALLAISVAKAWRAGWKRVRPFNATRTALQMEDHHGGLESLLVTAVQLRDSKLPAGTSEQMREATCRKAEEASTTLQPEKVVRYTRLRRPLAVAVALALVIGGFAVVNGPFLAAGIARIFPPWSAMAYPTRTQLDLGKGDMVVQEGTPALIQAQVSGVVPGTAKLALRTGTGKPRVHELEITDGVCEYSIDSAFRGFEYRIMAGDARSAWHSVQVIPSPRIERAEVGLEFPAYTERPVETVDALTVTVPEGTRVQWRLTLDRAVNAAKFHPTEGNAQPLTISEDGRTVSMGALATKSQAYRFSWVEKEHGFSFTSPNHYLQVAPDQSPRVELTSPASNLYATLGRKLDLALRARDDHGIGESLVTYRVNKIEEEKIPFTAPKLGAGGVQQIDWDYRTTLPDLAVGDSVSFVVEVADRYPGANGPHRARSQARRVTFLSEDDYLAQIAKQRQRLLSQLRSVYREERAVHATIRNLDPSSDIFIQSCQLEAVRQDLMGERLGALEDRMEDLLADLAANNITDESETGTLVRLSAELGTIADEHLGRAATSLRDLAGASTQAGAGGAPDPAAAVHMVDRAARELALMVLQVGFREATEVMARELHAISETQARLRLQTMLSGEATEAEAVAKAQDELTQWITRLFSAMPRDKESSIDDALVAFNLSRLIKELRGAGVDTKMTESAALIRTTGSADAAALQADVIRSLLAAEFRLRIGAEREALVTAGELFQMQANNLGKLRSDIAALSAGEFQQRQAELARTQTALQRKLHLLLMPAIPAPRPRLFDADPPPAPPVDALLASAETAMKRAVTGINAGDREKAAIQQQQAENSFDALSGVVRERLAVLTERDRVGSLVGLCGKHATEIAEYVERQLVLLEMTEDAEDNGTELARISQLQQKLADRIVVFQAGIVEWDEKRATPGEDLLPLLSKLETSARAMGAAVPALKENKPDEAIEGQETALEALEVAGILLEKQAGELTSLASTLNAEWMAMMPAPYVADIRAEQIDLVAAAPKAEKADLPRLAIVQKNLIHAVNAVLASLDPLAHQIESGTAFLFAKEDMDAAAVALETNDLAEAEDAGSFVAESLQDLLVKLGEVTPQYTYVLEVTEFLHEIVTEGAVIRALQGQLRGKAQAAPDGDALGALVEEQRQLESRAKSYGTLLEKAMGRDRFHETARTMADAASHLRGGDRDAAVEAMEVAEETLDADTEELGELMTHFAVLLEPLEVQPAPEVLFTLEILAVASQQKSLYRKTQLAKPEQAATLTTKQRELAAKCADFVPRADSHPKLLAASRHISEAAAHLASSASPKAIASQSAAGDVLRHFMIEYVQEYVIPPGPPPPSDPALTDPTESLGDDFTLFMPGAVSGGKPKGGRQEWEVLGRRDRAALNENFARELPLEYRAILKDYYERLAR